MEGMTCAGCVSHVEAALRSGGGVRDVVVNLTTETAEVAGENVTADGLIEAVREAGYGARVIPEAREGQAVAGLAAQQADRLRQHRQAVVIAVMWGVPIVALQWLGPALLSGHESAGAWWRGIQGVLTAMLLLSSAGRPILVGGVRSLLHRSPNMDLLIASGVLVAFVSSVVATVALVADKAGYIHYQAAAMILVFINAGRYLEARTKRQAALAVAALAQRVPTTTVRMQGGTTETVPLAARSYRAIGCTWRRTRSCQSMGRCTQGPGPSTSPC